ncbi:Alpha/Beta hydrolase protein [Trametes punicea]|nr:Alpha/Beta hydrolase protein [Trametes punicea]
MKEGHIDFPYQGETYQTYYKIFGNFEAQERTPIVVLHGEQSYSVVFYDQLGNARSTHLPDKLHTLWTIDLFLDEWENFLRHLGIQDDFYIVGHSWGGMMAAEFVVRRHPPGLRRLVISNAPAAAPMREQLFKELLQSFPREVRDAVSKGFQDRERYSKALKEVYTVHGCRVNPVPEELEHTLLLLFGENADRTVSEARITAGWTIVDRLHLVEVPTLVINGRYDFVQDIVIKPYSDNIL